MTNHRAVMPLIQPYHFYLKRKMPCIYVWPYTVSTSRIKATLSSDFCVHDANGIVPTLTGNGAGSLPTGRQTDVTNTRQCNDASHVAGSIIESHFLRPRCSSSIPALIFCFARCSSIPVPFITVFTTVDSANQSNLAENKGRMKTWERK